MMGSYTQYWARLVLITIIVATMLSSCTTATSQQGFNAEAALGRFDDALQEIEEMQRKLRDRSLKLNAKNKKKYNAGYRGFIDDIREEFSGANEDYKLITARVISEPNGRLKTLDMCSGPSSEYCDVSLPLSEYAGLETLVVINDLDLETSDEYSYFHTVHFETGESFDLLSSYRDTREAIAASRLLETDEIAAERLRVVELVGEFEPRAIVKGSRMTLRKAKPDTSFGTEVVYTLDSGVEIDHWMLECINMLDEQTSLDDSLLALLLELHCFPDDAYKDAFRISSADTFREAIFSPKRQVQKNPVGVAVETTVSISPNGRMWLNLSIAVDEYDTDFATDSFTLRSGEFVYVSPYFGNTKVAGYPANLAVISLPVDVELLSYAESFFTSDGKGSRLELHGAADNLSMTLQPDVVRELSRLVGFHAAIADAATRNELFENFDRRSNAIKRRLYPELIEPDDFEQLKQRYDVQ